MIRPTPPDLSRAFLGAALVVAGLRLVAAMDAAPLFGPVDEQHHFDMVLKAARHQAGSERFLGESAVIFAECGSREYLEEPRLFRTPPSRAAIVAGWSRALNREFLEPPVYYLLAGSWLRLGERTGRSGCRLAYWVRWLNVPFYLAIILVAAALTKDWYPDRVHVGRGVILLLAVLPQDCFVFMTNDAPVALLAGTGFWLMARPMRQRPWPRLSAALGGACLTLAMLTKLVAIPIAGVFLALPVMGVIRATPGPGRHRALGIAALAWAGALLPVLAWRWWAASPGGVAGAVVEKLLTARIEPASLSRALAHPLLTWTGTSLFIRDFLSSFWLGEAYWHGAPPVRGIASAVVVATTLAALPAAAFPGAGRRDARWLMEGVAVAAVVVMALILAIFSVTHDFSRSEYPSAAYPYLTSGRLAMGTLLPFLFAWVSGLDRLARRVGWPRGGAILVGVTALALSFRSVGFVLQAMASPVNWFHLP